jgi:hypothetical protein
MDCSVFHKEKNFPRTVWITRLHLWISLEITKYPQVLLQYAQWIGRVCKYLKYRVNSLFRIMKYQCKEVY